MDIKLKSKIKYLLFILLMFLPISISHAKEVPEHNSNYFVDELGVLSEDTKNLINNQNFKDGEQIFVLTVDKMDEDPFDYGMKAFKKYQLGDKEKDNGLLILLARTSEGKHHIRVITGYGLEDILPDGKIGRTIGNYMMDYFRDGDLDAGINSGFRAFEDIIKTRRLPVEENISQGSNTVKNIFSAFLYLCFFLFLYARRKKKIKQIKEMTYQDFLKSDSNFNSSYDGEYFRRLKELSLKKDSHTIKRDMKNAITYKSFFNSVYQEKKLNELLQLKLNQLMRDSNNSDEMDDTIYKDAISEKVKDISYDVLKDCMVRFSGFHTFYILEREYTIRKRKELSKLPLKELDRIRLYKEDEFLRKDIFKELVNEVIDSKLKDLEERELDEEEEKSISDDMRLKIIEEKRRRKKIQEEEERRRRSYYDDDDDDDWYFNSSSWSSSSSSSSFGGFSGGGGSSGGGGAGRSF